MWAPREVPPPVLERARRVARVALGVLLAAYTFYAVALNALLSSGALASWVSAATPDLALELDGAWTLLPGRVHVRAARVWLEDSHMQTYVTTGRTAVDIDVLPLLGRTIRLRRVRAEHVTFWFRSKVADLDDAKRAARAARYPRIPGRGDVAFLQPSPPRTPEETARLWSVELRDTEGTLDDLWMEEIRYRGAGSVRGSFRLEPARTLWLWPTRLELDGGALSSGDDSVARSVHAKLLATVEELDVSDVDLAAFLRSMSMTVDLRADLDRIPAQLYTDQPVAVGSGSLEVAGTLSDGVLATGSRAALDFDGTYRSAALRAQGHTFLSGTASAAGRVDLALDVPSGQVTLADGPGNAPISVTALSVRAVLAAPTLMAAHLRGAELRVDAVDAPNASVLAPLLGSAAPQAGKLHVALQATVDASFAAAGTLSASASGIDVRTSTARLTGSGTADGAFEIGPRLSSATVSRLDVRVPRLSVAVKGRPARSSTFEAHIRALSWTGRETDDVTAQFTVRGTNAALLTAPFERGVIASVATAGLVGESPFSASGSLRASRGAAQLRVGRAAAGNVVVRGGLVTRGAGIDGAFLLEAVGINVGIRIRAGDLTLAPFRSDAWLSAEMVSLRLAAR